ncbi:hypothetical protein WJM97_07210 [Okeanomitos corallinicola TIOX110]|uniref:Uncharacterized protein n=1 Tax=Okeanomitos corallinicola TIOX110 TaxID=3133117 RepID=A0ABZ2UVP9_9CYAN
MEDKKSHHQNSLKIDGGTFSHVQIGQAGSDLTQNQQYIPEAGEKQLTVNEVVELITQIESLFRTSDLPEQQKKQALKHLDYANDAVQEKEPDKNTAVISLQKATKVLKEANETANAGQGLWQKLEPISKQLAPWLGIAVKNILFAS